MKSVPFKNCEQKNKRNSYPFLQYFRASISYIELREITTFVYTTLQFITQYIHLESFENNSSKISANRDQKINRTYVAFSLKFLPSLPLSFLTFDETVKFTTSCVEGGGEDGPCVRTDYDIDVRLIAPFAGIRAIETSDDTRARKRS